MSFQAKTAVTQVAFSFLVLNATISEPIVSLYISPITRSVYSINDMKPRKSLLCSRAEHEVRLKLVVWYATFRLFPFPVGKMPDS